jgi:ribosome-binding factor A
MLSLASSAARRAVAARQHGTDGTALSDPWRRGYKWARQEVVQRATEQVRWKEHQRFRKEVEWEGSEPRWEELQQRIKKSPGRKSLGRVSVGMGRKETLRGFKQLDLLDLVAESADVSPRVVIHHKEELKQGIPEAAPPGGKPATRRVKRIEEHLLLLLNDAILERRLGWLDERVRAATGDEHALIEVSRVEVSADLMNANVFWLPPLQMHMMSEAVLDELDFAMKRTEGKLRTLIAHRLARRRAPFVTCKHDERAGHDERLAYVMGAIRRDVELQRSMTTEEWEELLGEKAELSPAELAAVPDNLRAEFGEDPLVGMRDVDIDAFIKEMHRPADPAVAGELSPKEAQQLREFADMVSALQAGRKAKRAGKRREAATGPQADGVRPDSFSAEDHAKALRAVEAMGEYPGPQREGRRRLRRGKPREAAAAAADDDVEQEETQQGPGDELRTTSEGADEPARRRVAALRRRARLSQRREAATEGASEEGQGDSEEAQGAQQDASDHEKPRAASRSRRRPPG